MSRAVHIIALGANTAVGFTAESSAAAVRAGISRVREHPAIVDAACESLKCACDTSLDPQMFGVERMHALAKHALVEVARKLTANRPYSSAVPVQLALPELRPGFSQDQARALQRQLATAQLPKLGGFRIESSCDGHAGALRALEVAFQRVGQGQLDLCIVGGVDSYLEVDTLAWLESDMRLSQRGNRSGFPPGEGACMLAVASSEARSVLELPSIARVRSAATTQEKRSADDQAGLLGEGLTEVISRVAGALRRPRERFDDVYCDINGERERTDDYGFALLRSSQLFRDGSAYKASTRECGDLGAASAAFHCVLATQAWQRGYAHGPIALVWGASWSGLRGAAILEQGGG